MELHFNVKGESRKALVKVISENLGIRSKYLGAPTFAYQIGDYEVSRDGVLTWADMDDADSEHLNTTSDLIDACVMAGFEPEEWENFREQDIEEDETAGFTVDMPRDYFTEEQLENLKKLVNAKAGLLKQALQTEELPVIITDEKVSFPWFHADTDADEYEAYTRLVTSICRMAKEAKRITAKEKEVDNPKYAFRCFLLRLGFIGEEFKQSRKVLLKNLSGSSAFKSGQKGGKE